jgi:AraC-like DNA-binding protein
LILREVPDLPPRPLTAAAAAFRAWFYARWRRENAVIHTHTAAVEYPPYMQTLSIKLNWNGAEHYELHRRRVSVDDDSYLILNRGNTYGSRISSRRPVGGMCVFFRPGMAEEVHAALTQRGTDALETPDRRGPTAFDFSEHLRSHGDAVSRRLHDLRRRIEAGLDDEERLEEELQALLAAMIEAEPGVRLRSERLVDLSHSTRAELQRRVDLASDFISSHHAEPLTLNQIAEAARLSKFHLVRLFKHAHGITPFEALARKRSAVALRLLTVTDLPLDDIAALAGFGSRVSMFRQLRQRYGAGGRQLRKLPRASEQAVR